MGSLAAREPRMQKKETNVSVCWEILKKNPISKVYRLKKTMPNDKFFQMRKKQEIGCVCVKHWTDRQYRE